jgi:hypothetical protein
MKGGPDVHAHEDVGMPPRDVRSPIGEAVKNSIQDRKLKIENEYNPDFCGE